MLEAVLFRFHINVIFRVVIFLLLSGGIVTSLHFKFYLTTFFLTIFLVVAVVNLIKYVTQTNRDLANFLASVKYDDFTSNTSAQHKGKSFGELHSGFNLINRKFRDIRAEKEANHQFLQTMVEHINVGLLGINDKEEVILMNKSLQKMLHKSYLINLDGIGKVDKQLCKTVKELEPGQRELVKVNIQNNLLQLSISAVAITLKKESFRLISFQNIQNELEAQELIASQKLIRILTHEIMNSVAPIASLSSTINEMLNRPEKTVINGQLENIKRSIQVIQKRSEGLLDFTETYRQLTRIPPPKFQIVSAKSLINEVQTLLVLDFEKHRIRFEKQLPSGEEFSFQGDPHLLEQVLINLVKNAIDAVKDNKHPIIKASAFYTSDRKINIQIVDNGKGIPKDMMDQIFVPFFTTKTEGSGIGLSLSRQIVRMHKGNIDIQSTEGEGTLVTIRL